MTPELQKAIDCLQVSDISLHSCNLSLAEGFDPKYSDEVNELQLKFRHLVARSETLTFENDEDQPLCLFRVFIVVGTRWVTEDGSDDHAESDGQDDVKASIEATFVAEYRFTENPGKEALEAFALKNASYHVWPYWREYLMNQAMRMNLPKVALPVVQFVGNQNPE